MAIFTPKKGQDNDCVKLCELLNYIRNPMATNPNLVYGSYVSCRYPFDEMMIVKQCFVSPMMRTLQGRQFFHYIVSLPEEESDNVEGFTTCMIAINQFIANYQGAHFQTLHAIHLNTDNLHAHIILNNIDIFTGARLDLDLRGIYGLRNGVNDILQRHGFSGIYKKEMLA